MMKKLFVLNLLFVFSLLACVKQPVRTNIHIAEGKKIAESTQKVLGSNLMKAMRDGGPAQAIEFCNEQAYPLTDSMALTLHTKIKRVTDKPRNPQNKANKAELIIIKEMKKAMAKGKEVKAVGLESPNGTRNYYPIITQGLCLSCHGKNLNNDLTNQLKKLYPNDIARGYEVNELRGLWAIEVNR
ncbi:Tll0287-like domain-containing protein [Jiulongibacter sp. NS-SX5]|uniref:Tll0287-like domain-containing protein n=1 Tax=Jiulongibacter sp. NS-SX5 TaxID=3463854 RepID=UPI004059FB9C